MTGRTPMDHGRHAFVPSPSGQAGTPWDPAVARETADTVDLIERATRRLQDLERAGVAVPWDLANRPGAAQRRAAAAPPRSPAPQQRSAAITLDLAQLEAAGLLVPTQANSPLSEEFRHVKRALLHNLRRHADALHGRGNLVMLTSALPGEGKTFCAINLAMSLAMEVDTRVLLVDADVLRPSIPARLGVRADTGLLDLLADPALAPSTVMLNTNVPKLSLLPAGTADARATERLASTTAGALLGELAERYPDRMVILDAPPLLSTSAAGALAPQVGQIVMVVEAARTPRDAVAQAYAEIEACPVVLSLLNKCSLAPGQRRHGYSYG